MRGVRLLKAMLGTAEGQAALEAEKLAILAEADAKEKLRAKLASLNLDDDPAAGPRGSRAVRFGMARNSSTYSNKEDDDDEEEYSDDQSDGVLVEEEVDEEIGYPIRKGPGHVTHRHRAARSAAAAAMGGEMAATHHRHKHAAPHRRRKSSTALGLGGSRTAAGATTAATAATSGLFGGPSLRELWHMATSSVGGVVADSLGPRATVVQDRARKAHHVCKSSAARAKKWVTLTLHGTSVGLALRDLRM